MRPDKRRGAGAAVQVLVAATDGKVRGVALDPAAMHVHRHGAGRVRQIPDHQRAGRAGRARHLRHPEHAAGAVIHVRQHQHGQTLVEHRGHVLGVDEHELEPVVAGHRVGDVQVRRKIRPLRHDATACARRTGRCREVLPGDGHRRVQHLVQVRGRGIGHDHLAGSRAHKGRDLVADALGGRDPASGVPAPHQPAAPLVFDDLAYTRGRGRRQGPQRVAIQVDQPLGIRASKVELTAQSGQRVSGVELQAPGAGRDHSDLNTARTGDASTPGQPERQRDQLVVTGRHIVEHEVLENPHAVYQELPVTVEGLAIGRIDGLRVDAHEPDSQTGQPGNGLGCEDGERRRPRRWGFAARADQHARRKAGGGVRQVFGRDQRAAVDRVNHTARPEIRLERHIGDGGRIDTVMQRRIGVCAEVGRHGDGAQVHGTSRPDPSRPLLAERRIARKRGRLDGDDGRDVPQGHERTIAE